MTDDETLYRAHHLRADARRNIIVIVVSAFANVLFLANDLRLVEPGAGLAVLLATRAVDVIAAAVMIAILVRSASPRAHDRTICVFLALHVILGAYVASTRPSDFSGYAVANVVVVNVLYFVLAGPVGARSAAAVLISVSSLWFLLRGTADPAQKTTLTVTHVLLQVLGLSLVGRNERLRRDGFLAHLAEQRARAELAAQARELASARDRAEALARTKDDLLAMMSHELRTPMNAVLGLSGVLERTALSGEQRELVRAIHGSARALFVVLADILGLADAVAGRAPAGGPRFALRDAVRGAIAIARHQASEAGRAVEVVTAPDVPEGLAGDAPRLRQLLVHLLANALAVAGEGAIVVEVAARPLGGGEHEITFAVRGTGVGVTLRAREAELPPVRDSADELVSNRALRLLVVDDNALNREVALALLGRLGLAADVAASGAEAVAAATRQEYDLILMDLRMPDMSGLEATRRILDALPEGRHPRVVALSASTFASDRAACAAVGMVGFLGKPLDIEELRAVLEAVAASPGGDPPGRASPPAPPAPPAREPSPVPAAPAPAGRPRLDPAALALLKDLSTPDAPDFFRSVCRRFLADAAARIERLESAAASGDAETAGREAHTLKTAAATVGAWQMSATCASLESAARRGDLSGHAAAAQALRAELSAVEQALTEAAGGALF